MLPRRLVQEASGHALRWRSVVSTGLLAEAGTSWRSKAGISRPAVNVLASWTSESKAVGMSERRLASTAAAPDRAPQYSSCCARRFSAARAYETRVEAAATVS